MGNGGGILVKDKLDKLKLELEEYYGKIAELKAGLNDTSFVIPEKPDALVVYELIQSTGLPLVPGGLMQQPHIWLMQWEVIDGTKKLFDHLDEIAEANKIDT